MLTRACMQGARAHVEPAAALVKQRCGAEESQMAAIKDPLPGPVAHVALSLQV